MTASPWADWPLDREIVISRVIDAPKRLVWRAWADPELHGADDDNDPGAFRMLVTFDEQANGKTVITLRQMHPTADRRSEVIGFGAVEYGGQTLGKLAAHVAAQAG